MFNSIFMMLSIEHDRLKNIFQPQSRILNDLIHYLCHHFIYIATALHLVIGDNPTDFFSGLGRFLVPFREWNEEPSPVSWLNIHPVLMQHVAAEYIRHPKQKLYALYFAAALLLRIGLHPHKPQLIIPCGYTL